MSARHAVLMVLTKMAQVILTFKIMPESPDVDLSLVKQKASDMISEFGGEVGKSEEQPIAFGLKALLLFVVMDESKGSTDSLEENLGKVEGVQSVEVTDVRRAIG